MHQGDALSILRTMSDESINCCVTSPPYWRLRDYGVEGQLGLESTPSEYVGKIVEVFAEVRRVLRSDGTLWLNLGDTYNNCDKWGGGGSNTGKHTKAPDCSIESWKAVRRKWSAIDGLKPKDLIGIPWRVAFALQADGWYLRSDIIWHKPNPMPESVQGSHYSRHTVTIEEYERLSGLRYVDERAGDDWAGDMPHLSEREVFSNKAPLSAISQRHSHGSRKGGSRGRAGEAEAVQQVTARDAQQSQIRSDGKGQGGNQEEDREISSESTGKASRNQEARGDEGPSGTDNAEKISQQQVHQDGQGESVEAARLCHEEGSYSGDRLTVDGGGLAGNSDSTQGHLSLLQEGTGVNGGSRNSAEQGRPAYEGQRSASVSTVQFEKEGQAGLQVGCPGCPKCIKYHGYTFHLSAGRPTKAHEYVFLLSKSERYFYDADAIAEPITHVAHSRMGNKNAAAHGLIKLTGNMATGKHAKPTYTTRNKRTVWTVATHPYSEAHFATFPQKLIEPCILAGCPIHGTVLDPFSGSGTTGVVALRHQRSYIGIELNPDYIATADRRIGKPDQVCMELTA